VYLFIPQEKIFMTHKIIVLTIQKWGSSLAVRIPAALARSAHFELGTIVELDAQDGNILVKSRGHRKPTLDERLAAFDLKKHGGEAMPVKPAGLEKF
jgi:antitoxin MazE